MKKSALAAFLILFLYGCDRLSIKTIDKAKFEPLYRISKSLQVVTVSGVTLIKFRELNQQAAIEISLAKDKVSNASEGIMLSAYEEALGVYRDSQILWDAQIDPKAFPNDAVACKDDVTIVASKYKMDCLKYGVFSLIPQDSFKYLWFIGSKKTDQANAIYLGTQSEYPQNKIEEYRREFYKTLVSEIDKYNQMQLEIKEKEHADAATAAAARKRRLELDKGLREIFSHFVRQCEANCEPGKWYWKDIGTALFNFNGDLGFSSRDAALKDALSNESLRREYSQRSTNRLSQQTNYLADGPFCFAKGSEYYHKKTCGVLHNNAICVEKENLPPGLKPCWLCNP